MIPLTRSFLTRTEEGAASYAESLPPHSGLLHRLGEGESSCYSSRMLAFTALTLIQPKQDVRTLALDGMLFTTAQVKITRTFQLDGSVEWLEEMKWDDGRVWNDRRILAGDGSLIFWSIDWKSSKGEMGGNDASWKSELAEGGYRITKSKYQGESMRIVSTQKLDPAAYRFKHLTLQTGSAPVVGEPGKALLFIPGIADAGQLHDTEAVFAAQEDVQTPSGKVRAHKIVLKSEPRGETWWLDSTGMPVRRELWTKSPSSPHRVEVMR
jgi:hypothetical protein